MQNRIQKVRQILKDEGLDGLLISSSLNIAYLTGFTGFDFYERGGYAFLTANKLYLFANSLYAEEAKHEAKRAEVIALTRDQKLIPSLQDIIAQEKIKVVGFEENLTYSEFKVFKKLKGVKLKLADEIVEEVRVVKDTSELESLKKACKLTDDCFTYILSKIKLGITEKELAWEMEQFIKENGGELAFPTIVAFGDNSATPHHKTNNDVLRANNIILLDFGAKVDGFCADMTRTVFFGKAPEKFRKMYEAVLESQLKAINYKLLTNAKTLTPHHIDQVARDYIVQQGYPPIPHSVGHGVGMEVHELPHISPGFKDTLEPNTLFTIEPGVYVPGFGGVRIEDTFCFNGSKIIPLTTSPKELIEL